MQAGLHPFPLRDHAVGEAGQKPYWPADSSPLLTYRPPPLRDRAETKKISSMIFSISTIALVVYSPPHECGLRAISGDN